MPNPLRWQFRYQLFADSGAQAKGQSIVALSGSLARLSGQRITLSFAPATDADASTLASFMPHAHSDNSPIQASEFPLDVPGYLIRVKAELRADGVVVASGGNFMLGSELIAETAAFDPALGDWRTDINHPHAGDYQAVVIDPQGVSPLQVDTVMKRLAALEAKLAAGQVDSLSRDDVTGDVLYQTALNYFATVDANAALFQRAAGVIEQRLPSYGRAVAQAQPHMTLGLINKVSFPGVILDIDRLSSAVATQTGGLEAAAYSQQSNQRNAAYAHLVLNKLHTSATRPGQSASAVNVLGNAAVQNQPVYGLTNANSAALLPQITLNERAKADVQDAIAAGYRVFVAQQPSSIGAWSGQALLIEDPQSGTAAYRLLDGNGDATAALYLPSGMGWLAQASPIQAAASIVPITQAAQSMDQTLLAMLAGDGGGIANTTHWQNFPAQDEVASGLFLSRLAGAQDNSTCDRLTGMLAAIGGTGGLDTGGVPSATPFITSIPVIGGTAGQTYQYAVTAVDPQGGKLTYRLTDGPNTMTIGNAGLITWPQPVSGSFAVTVRADNGAAYAEQRYVLSVGKQALPLEIALTVAPAIVNQGETVRLTVLTNGGSGVIGKTLSVDGQIVALDNDGQALITGNSIGVHPILVSARDSLGAISKTSLFSVRNPSDVTPPIALISTPSEDTEITAPLNIVGTVSDANLAYYQLLLRPAGDGAWREIARGNNSVTNGVLGRLDPTQLQNGIYELSLNAVDINGRQTNHVIPLDIYRDLKIGQFAISFEDINIEASGIPIRVTRTYDTRKKADNLDFGYGWSVDYQSLQIRKNKLLGLDWQVVSSPTSLSQCLRSVGAHKINITLPTGKVERFTATNAQECALATVPPVDIIFSPLPGTTSKLALKNHVDVLAQGGQLYAAGESDTWNATDFTLTTEDHYIYTITEGIGITQIEDPSGNTLTYGQNGILHSNGQSISFTRDAAGRIATISDPLGKQIVYEYDAPGDLVSVTDRSAAISTLRYNRNHGLTDFTDPRGIVTARYVYDDNGRLIAVYDADGKAIETTHDDANNKETIKDRRGNSTTYTYNAAGDITEKLDALQHKTVYSYDALGNETETVDALGHSTVRSFDAKTGKQLSETDPQQNRTTWSYDPATPTQLASYTDARKNTTTYTYAGNGGQSIHEPLGRTSNIGLDSGGNLTALTVAGQTTHFDFDAKGNKIQETDAAGNVTTFGYDDNNKETSRSWTRTLMVNGVPTPKTLSVTRKLDANGRVIEETDAMNHTVKTQYNAAGQIAVSTDAQGRQTRYEYNPRGKLVNTIYPDDSNERIDYDPENNQASTTDRQGRVTHFEYDALNRLTKTSYPDGGVSSTEYDAVGRVQATIDANGNRTDNTYDKAGRLINIRDAQTHETKFAYDPNGNTSVVTDAQGKETHYEYDALNRLIKTTFPDTRIATTVWRPDGRKQSETDANGNIIEYGYSPIGQLAQVKQTNDATAQVTQYGFDNAGNKTSQTDAEQHLTQWEYDANNRVTSRTLPASQKESFTYDAVGNVITKTDFNGKQTRFDYNNVQQLNQTTRPDGASIVSTFTPSGQIATILVTAAADSGLQTGKTTYAYDAQDRIIRQTNPDGGFLAYGYDPDGNIVQRSTVAGTVKYSYGPNKRIATVTDIDGKITRYTYDNLNRLSTIATPNGVTGTYGFDANGRLLQLLYKNSTGGIVTGVRYTLAANGQRQTMDEFDAASTIDANNAAVNPLRSSTYIYDSVNRLTEEKITDRSGAIVRTTRYRFDKVGNRAQKTEITNVGTAITNYIYDNNDRLSQETKTTVTGGQVLTLYAWDNNGNLKSKATGGQVILYNWDSDNRLIEVKQGANAAVAQTVVKYVYDSNGNRIGKVEAGQGGQADRVTRYLTDSTFPYAQVVQESTTRGDVTELTRYVWGAGLIGQVRGGQGVYTHADGIGSTKAISDANGNITDTYSYDAFGNQDSHTGTSKNPYRYTGEYFDDTINLQYNRARFYDRSVGRFVSQDPASGVPTRPATLHKYAYADGDPVNKRDPNGRFTVGEVLTAVGTAFTLYTVFSTSYNVTTKLQEDDLSGATSNLAVGIVTVGALSFGPDLFRIFVAGCTKWCKVLYTFSLQERAIIAEVKAIQRSGIYAQVRAALAAEKEAQFIVGNSRNMHVAPGLRDFGMSLFKTEFFLEEGFIIGRASNSELEFLRTCLHEIYRLTFQGGVEAGATGGAAAATEAATSFAGKAIEFFIKGL